MSKKKKKKADHNGEKLSTKHLQKEILQLLRDNPKKRFNPKQIIKKLHIANNQDSVQHALQQLVEQNQLIELGDFKFKVREEAGGNLPKQIVEGRMDMTRSGAGYVVAEGREDDIYVAQRYMNTAMHGDWVRIRTWKPRGRHKPEGEVMEIVERANEQFVGTLNLFNRFAVVAIDGNYPMDIMVDADQLNGGKDGDKVVVKVTDWSSGRYNNPVGEVTTVLGQPGSSDIDMQAILINNGFNISFPKEVLHESQQLSEHISPQEIEMRRDFRDTVTFTIDPIDAKDFDDALSIRYLENEQVEIGVHIADVSHYVKPGSSLDKEAYRRSTSVYLVDRVCPMLPEKLSNALCSLRPNEDKLVFSAVFVFDKNHRVVRRWFGKGIIHSNRRFTYEDAQQVLESGEGDFAQELLLLNTIAKKLRDRRFKQGSIDFDSEEVRFQLAADGTPIAVYVKERKDSNMLIEDFMLLANREVASFINRKAKARGEHIPFVYRVHDEPNLEKAAELALFAKQMGFEMDVTSPRAIARSYNRLIEAAEKEPGLKLLAPLAIRTMAKAEYSTDNIGHYGLGFDFYTHFTSPIRRYSDVLAHRILEKNLGKDDIYKENEQQLEEKCKHVSRQERRAADAERESIKYKQVEYMHKHVGEVFPGLVSGITDFGIFVELLESRCEGMISYDHMKEPFELGGGRLSTRGQRTGMVIKMGDEIQVRILDADISRRRIDMSLVEGPTRHVDAGDFAKQDGRTDRRRSSSRKGRPAQKAGSKVSSHGGRGRRKSTAGKPKAKSEGNRRRKNKEE